MTVTTKKTYRKPSKKSLEKRAAFLAMAEQLSGELKEGKHTERLARAAQTVKGLEKYSDLNQLLIITQCPEATEVAGYVAWQERGFKAKGPGIAIRAPHDIKGKKASQQEGEEGPAKVGFHRTYVWDVTQVIALTDEEKARLQAKAAEAAASQGDEEEDEAAENPAAE